MRWIFAAWALPMGIFWGWYFLSLNDMNFGYVMLTRDAHDILFELYGQVRGIEPATIVYNPLNQPRELVKAEIVTNLFA